MIIAVEGLDGTGKTTISKYISKKYNYQYKNDYLEKMLNLTEEQFFAMKEKINDYLEVRTLIFMSSLVYNIQTAPTNTVFDRYILSEYYYDGSQESEEWFKTFVKKEFLPDLTFILYADDDIRRKRIYKRNKNDKDLKKISKGRELYKKMLFFANENNMNYVLINTNNLELNQIENIVDEYMSKFIKEGKKCIIRKMLK